ncbi:hypothetical protein OGAPHI_006735 [Ogataea philodendri]|uniref:Uncharacterized protein n=1 Tax=Ogataea philodendri TaxID=1378263 RepID=A0A9P8NW07_9ASCO|nr:uncharacterized protein OGAPHI_006735 [Ogataea philodendri]KAH3661328.1 hypothetical protein OGAPHI_006735 [Ogataea philodendri]
MTGKDSNHSTLDMVPDLVSDSDTDDEMNNYTYERSYMHHFSAIDNERKEVMYLVVRVACENIALRQGINQASLERFVRRILERSGLGMATFIRGLSILQRSTSPDCIYRRILYSMIVARGIPQDLTRWSRVSGISSERLQSEVRTFAQGLGKTAVQDEEVYVLNQNIKTEVLKYVKIAREYC